MSEAFLLGDDDFYGPQTNLVRDTLRQWLAYDNIEHQFNIKGYHIHTLPPLPNTIKKLIIGGENLVLIKELPSSLINLSCTDCPNVRRIPNLPDTIESVDFSRSGICELPRVPITIKSIIASNTDISRLPYLYTGLQELIISGTNITKLKCKVLPETLFTLDIRGTKITKLPDLNRGLKTLNISNTEISVLPPVPRSLMYLYVRNCKSLLVQRDHDWPMHNSGMETIESYNNRWDSWRDKEYSKIRCNSRNSLINLELLNSVFQNRSPFSLN